MRSTQMIRRVCAVLLCVTLFSAAIVPVNARGEGFLMSLFLLSLLDEYGLTDITQWLLLLGLEHEDELYDLYQQYGDTDQSAQGVFSDPDMYGYDAEGYPVYEDEATGFLYGVYDSGAEPVRMNHRFESGDQPRKPCRNARLFCCWKIKCAGC